MFYVCICVAGKAYVADKGIVNTNLVVIEYRKMEAHGKHADTNRLNELKVLNHELGSIRSNALVYKKQQNSNIFFLENKHNVFAEAKRELDNLIKNYDGAANDGATNK